jgi:hypothetical protein
MMSATAAVAQPVITSPNNGTVVVAGSDFATDVYNDAWDFSNEDDLSPFPDEYGGWQHTAAARLNGRSVFLNSGRFVSTTDTSAGNKISMLYRGGIGVDSGRAGATDAFAIDTTRYGKLAIKMRVTGATSLSSQLLAIWYYRPYVVADEANNAGLIPFGVPTNGSFIYVVDLENGAWHDVSGALRAPGALQSPFGGTPRAWNSGTAPLVRGFEWRATSQSGAVGVEVDWVRLTARDNTSTARMMNVGYTNCSGAYTLAVMDAVDGATYRFSGNNGAATGTIPFNYGILAPGSYSMTLTCGTATSAPTSFTVNAPPQVSVLEPDVTGGADFATDVIGNAWDMDAPGDIALLAEVAPTPVPQIINNELVATGTATGDPQVTLLSGGVNLISTRKYRNLTFTLTLDTPFGLNGPVGEGSVARVFWGSSNGQSTEMMTTMHDMLVWPGRNTYTVDLGTLTLANGGLENLCPPPVCAQIPWTQRSVRIFRIDPHEATNPVQFRLGRVKLTAPDEVAFGNTFDIRYRFDDADAGGTYQARIYIDGDRNPSNGKSLIGTQTPTATRTDQVFTFDPGTSSSVATGEYYVYVEIVELRSGLAPETRGAYSTGVLRVFNLASSSPHLTVSNPTANSTQATGFTVQGCAFDQGNANGINVDDVAVFAIPGANVTGPQAGRTQVLGLGNTLGILEFGPLTGTALTCPTASGMFSGSGFRIANITGLGPGNWTLRVISRSTISGEFTTLPDIPFSVSNLTVAPTNLRVSGSGNTITLAWDAPTSGPPIGTYQIDFAFNSAFSPLNGQLVLPLTPTSVTGALPNGTWFFRVRSLAPSGAPGNVSNTVQVSLPFGVTAPGSPVLTATQVASNPITLAWAPGPGSAPTNYTVAAGTSPGGNELGSFPLGGITTITAQVPVGQRIYVRVIASNAMGSATSNEISFEISAPVASGAPTGLASTVAGRLVSLNWSAPTSGSAPTSYTVLVRLSPTGPVIASLPGVTSTSFSIPAPPGTYYLTVTAVNGAGQSDESNQVQVVVQ